MAGRWKTGALAAILILAATACGKRADLEPAAGKPAPVVPVGATAAPTTSQMTTPDAQAKPARSDELLRRSEQRTSDEFDLPPPG